MKNDSVNWLPSGKKLIDQNEYLAAVNFFTAIVAENPTDILAQFYLGLVNLLAGNLEAAQEIWLCVFLNSNPFEQETLTTQLADILINELYRQEQQQNFENIELLCQALLELDENNLDIWIRLADIYKEQRQIPLAIEALQAAISRQPANGGLYFRLAECYEEQKELYQAVLSYRKAIECDPKNLGSYIRLTFIEHLSGHSEIAINLLEKAITIFPQELSLFHCLADLYQKTGATDCAIKTLDRCLKIFPDDLTNQLIRQFMFPIIYHSEAEILEIRQGFMDSLISLAELKFSTPQQIDQGYDAIRRASNYYLHYQGFNDVNIQGIYGEFMHKILCCKFANFSLSNKLYSTPKNTSKIRIGYASSAMNNSIVSDLFLHWLRYADRQKFEIYSFYINPNKRYHDQVTEQYQKFSDYFIDCSCQDMLDDFQLLSEANLDIIVYLELGLEFATTSFAGLRFAPVQCAAWGHPVTSGLPTIDYFLSNDAMEPFNAQGHYTEKLIRLPGIGAICTPERLSTPNLIKQRSDFGLPSEAILYLSCQNFCKYLPQFDFVFAEICGCLKQRNRPAKIVFIERRQQGHQILIQFKHRLVKIFQQYQLNLDDYCLFLPPQIPDDYFQILLLSDIFLDTFAWSGGITSLDAVACHLPLVTCPGELMRGRQSYGILKMIDVTETIAQSIPEYIDLAFRLATDHDFHQAIKQKLAANKLRLCNGEQTIQALENFYSNLIPIDMAN